MPSNPEADIENASSEPKTTAQLIREFQENVKAMRERGENYDVTGQHGPQPDTEAAVRAHLDELECLRPLNAEERELRRQVDAAREARDKHLYALKLANRKRAQEAAAKKRTG